MIQIETADFRPHTHVHRKADLNSRKNRFCNDSLFLQKVGLKMVSLICSQVVLEIESKIKERFKLANRGFVIIFFKKNIFTIGYKVIDETKNRINLDEDEFANVDELGIIYSKFSHKLEVFLMNHPNQNQAEIDKLDSAQRVDILTKNLNDTYQMVANIPLKLIGIK